MNSTFHPRGAVSKVFEGGAYGKTRGEKREKKGKKVFASLWAPKTARGAFFKTEKEKKRTPLERGKRSGGERGSVEERPLEEERRIKILRAKLKKSWEELMKSTYSKGALVGKSIRREKN